VKDIRKLLAVAAGVAMVAAACSSKSHSGSSPSGGSGGGSHTINIGLLTDFTGLAASAAKTSVQGVEAGAIMAKRDGYTIHYTLADTQTSPASALSAAQKLVQQNHVSAVVAVSAIAFAAAPYLTAHDEPVVGVAEDGPEWIKAKNMFSTFGFLDTTKVSTLDGKLFKMLGATNIGTLGYSISPTSAEAAKSAAVSAQAAGLKVGYLNANFPFGSTNVQPVAIKMKAAGVDGLTASVDPNTGLALLTALRQSGDNPKVALFPTGYGADLSQGGPGAVQAAQGAYFTLEFEPVEMNTPATRQFAADLKAVGVKGDPTYGEYAGYTSVALLLQALKKTGPNPSHSTLIKALSSITNFDASGLLGNYPLSMANRNASGATGCTFITRLVGNSFHTVPNADPICGVQIPGKSVSGSS